MSSGTGIIPAHDGRSTPVPFGARGLRTQIEARCAELGLVCECSCAGNMMSDTAVIAEAPGPREVKLGEPLVGGSGQKFFEVMRKIGVNRLDVYMTNVVKRQLVRDDDDTDKKKVNVPSAELDMYRSVLLWELMQLPNLRHIIVLGNLALKAITGEDGIMKWRGSVVRQTLEYTEISIDRMPVRTSRDVDVICTVNPAFVLREPLVELSFRQDIGKYKKVRDGQWKQHVVNVHYDPTPDEAIDWCAKMRSSTTPVAFDIEVIGGETACIGFANSPNEAMCINFRDARENRWSLEDERRVRIAIQELLGDERVRFIAQNGAFDCAWLWFKDRIKVHKLWFDTMLVHHAIYPMLPHNLGFITAQYTTHPYYKDDSKEWREGGDIASFWKYNGTDCAITYAAHIGMYNEVERLGLGDLVFGHIMRLQHHLVRMTVGGVRIDVDLKTQIAKDGAELVQALLDKWHLKVADVTSNPTLRVNPLSHVQLGKLLFQTCGLVGRGSSVDDDNRKRMRLNARARHREDLVEMLDILDEYKTAQKFQSVYAEMLCDDDKRIRCEYRQTGVASAPGRLSSAKTPWGTGGNLQNQPEQAYEMFIADEGYTFVYFDLSQAEARVVGWLANIPSWIEQFERARLEGGYDCHRALAAEMFGIPYDEVPTYDRYPADHPKAGEVTIRYIAKRCRHGLNYRMAADRLATVTGLSLSAAMNAYATYHRITPELRKWWAAEEHDARTTRLLVSPLGRRLPILGRIEEDTLTSIVAFKPQSTVGDHVCRVIYLSEDDPEWSPHYRMALNIHDALIALVPDNDNDVARAARVMKRHAEMPIMINSRPLIIPAEFKVGRRILTKTLADGTVVPVNDPYIRWAGLKKYEVAAC